MRIGIISDTHGSLDAVAQAVSIAGQVDMWLHAGDCIGDSEHLAIIAGVPVYMVAGNCDWPDTTVPEERIVDVEGHRIFLTHGHNYGVRYDTKVLAAVAEEQGADIAVYGHTHIADISLGGSICVLNPGSAARPRDELRPSFMTAIIEPGRKPVPELIRMED